MNGEALDLADFILEQDLHAEIVAAGPHMPTMGAAAAVEVTPEQIFKSILFQARDGQCVMVVVCGNGRVDLERVKAITGLQGKLAKPDVVFAKTGYPADGTPPVGPGEVSGHCGHPHGGARMGIRWRRATGVPGSDQVRRHPPVDWRGRA